MNAVASIPITSSQNRDAENDLPSARVPPALITGRHRDRERVVVVERQRAVQGVIAVEPQPQSAERRQRAQPPVVGHHTGLGVPGVPEVKM